ncbi:hypothetical protein KUCAC02_006683, partial [Chaenocephalus aceratus]
VSGASSALRSLSLGSWNILGPEEEEVSVCTVCRYEQPACLPLGMDDTHTHNQSNV